jgi:predicted HTH transcriptional regulator
MDAQGISLAQVKKEIRKQLNIAVTKTIAAFLNTDGGTLLVGVDDSGTTLGIESDFGYFKKEKQNTDGWLLSLRQVVINALDPQVWSDVHISLVTREQGTIAVIRCPRRTSETWHHVDVDRFYTRSSNATQELIGPALVKYIRKRWPA